MKACQRVLRRKEEILDSLEAKKILATYRPGTGDVAEPQFAEALELARRDPELKRWFENHCTDYIALRTKLKQIPVPLDLRDRILAKHAAPRVNIWWRQPAFIGAAAVIVLLLTLVALWPGPKPDKSLAAFQARMIRAVRDYRMDLVTTNLAEIRRFLAAGQYDADYVLPASLEKLPGSGCARLTWQGEKVSMICFDTGEQQDLYLFVVERSELKNPPPQGAPQITQVNKTITASWSVGGKTYLLAVKGDETFIRKFL